MSRARVPTANTAPLLLQIEAIAEFARLRQSTTCFAEANAETLAAVFEHASRFAADRLETLNAYGEKHPPTLHQGRVQTGQLHRDIWAEFAGAGWLTLDLGINFGGAHLPRVVALAVQELFDRHSAAFGMLSVPIRSAIRLIEAFGDPHLKDEWLIRLANGEWGATICVSEADAGSDVARIKTKAARDDHGQWWVTGRKHWITFGDQDLTSRIGHCLLARTDAATGLSLFLVPSTVDEEPNGVSVHALERKLGLHLSPTCVLGFDGARAYLLGEEGRGLSQMFVMITNMRLAVAAMGLGLASGAADLALAYSKQRLQGGRGQTPTAIIHHPDVQQQLLQLFIPLEIARGLIYGAAVQLDLAEHDPDPTRRMDSEALGAWLLPIIKTLGGELAFDVASGAMQVLGGAGYTSDWPVEQILRDARVLTIFEGTTGMQALDLLHRRLWKDAQAGLTVFLREARAALDVTAGDEAHEFRKVLLALEQSANYLTSLRDRPAEAEASATAFLKLATLAGLCWSACHLLLLHGDPDRNRLRALAQAFSSSVAAKAESLSIMVREGTRRLEFGRPALEIA